MIEFKQDRIIAPRPHREPVKSNYVLKDLALKYYDQLEPIVNDLASRNVLVVKKPLWSSHMVK